MRFSGRGVVPQHAKVLLLWTAQVWVPPAETMVNVPAGAVRWLLLLLPQQRTVPTPRTPQEWSPPALTVARTAFGAVACPKVLSPQQVARPVIPTAQAWEPPLLVMVCRPEGESLTAPSLSVPQHTMVLLGWMPQVLLVRGDAGPAEGFVGRVGLTLLLYPQQFTAPLVRIPQL